MNYMKLVIPPRFISKQLHANIRKLVFSWNKTWRNYKFSWNSCAVLCEMSVLQTQHYFSLQLKTNQDIKMFRFDFAQTSEDIWNSHPWKSNILPSKLYKETSWYPCLKNFISRADDINYWGIKDVLSSKPFWNNKNSLQLVTMVTKQ